MLMKKINVYSILFSVISLFSCWAKAGAGLAVNYPVFEHHLPKLASVSLFDANVPDLFQEQAHSVNSNEISQFVSGEGKGDELFSCQGDGGHNAKFWKWLFSWFLKGRYQSYRVPGQSKLPNEPPSKEVSIKSSKIAPLEPKNKKVATRQKRVVTSTKTASNAVDSRPTNHSNGNTGSVSASKEEVISTSKAPETFAELRANAEANGVDFEDVESDLKPESFRSAWAWNILGWIQAAFRKYREEGSPSEYTFNDVLAFEDPALPAFTRGLLAVVQRRESVIDGTMTPHNKSLVTAALDYILIDHKIKTGANRIAFDWRKWVSIPPRVLKSSRFFEPRGYLQDTQKFSSKQLRRFSFHQLYKFKRDEYIAKNRPERFSSTSLWTLSVDLDRIASLHGDPFLLSLDSDPVLLEMVYVVLNVIYNTDSRLSDRECFLLEYWIDCMITVDGVDSEEMVPQWKRLSLEASIEGDDLSRSGNSDSNGDRGGIKRESARAQEYPNKFLKPCPSCGFRYRP